MKIFLSKYSKLAGTSYSEILKKAKRLYKIEVNKSKRNVYVRSCYFNKDKIFLTLFWEHLNQKPQRIRKNRLRYYQCALDLLRNTTIQPISKYNHNSRSQMLHRFAGITPDGDLSYVQVKENLKTKNKYFMSVFSPK